MKKEKKDFGILKFCTFIILVAISPLVCERVFHGPEGKYDEGVHLDYSIVCENGWMYKRQYRNIYPVLNTDGTHARCGTKVY